MQLDDETKEHWFCDSASVILPIDFLDYEIGYKPLI